MEKEVLGNTWNYRVLYNPTDGSYAIHEVYYDSKGNPGSWIERPSAPYGESLSEFKNDLAAFNRAFEMPFLRVTADGNHLIEFIPELEGEDAR